MLRTNCLDCLDRTNVVQLNIGVYILEMMMDRLKLLNQGVHGSVSVVYETFHSFWADAGDLLSLQYSGTTSTTASVSRTGKQNFFDKLKHRFKSVERYLQYNLQDDLKHECILIFLNKHPQCGVSGVRAFLESQLCARETSFVK